MAQFLVLQIQYAPQLCLKRREEKERGGKGREGRKVGWGVRRDWKSEVVTKWNTSDKRHCQ